MTVLVTGATGTTGSRVADLLDAAGADVRRVSRSSSIRFDWSDPSTHDAAFDGIDALYLVAPIGDAEPAHVVAPVLDRAVGRGLRRVAFLCSSAVDRGVGGLGELHDLVLRTAPEPTVLRASWFTQNFLSHDPGMRSLRGGEIVTATGRGRVPFVDAGDIAAVAAGVLLAATPPEPELLVTGPEALTYDDVCRTWTDLTGQPARHVVISEPELAARFTAAGMPPEFAAILAGLDGLIASGRQSAVGDTVARITGRPARSVRDVLAADLAVART